jgi:hypothetical protein
MDLAGLDHEVDVIVGYQIAEAFRDAAQFEFQRNLRVDLGVWDGPHGDDRTMGAARCHYQTGPRPAKPATGP